MKKKLFIMSRTQPTYIIVYIVGFIGLIINFSDELVRFFLCWEVFFYGSVKNSYMHLCYDFNSFIISVLICLTTLKMEVHCRS